MSIIIPQCQWNKYEDWQQQNYAKSSTYAKAIRRTFP